MEPSVFDPQVWLSPALTELNLTGVPAGGAAVGVGPRVWIDARGCDMTTYKSKPQLSSLFELVAASMVYIPAGKVISIPVCP
jgi:hypothetical protein